jgi:hypothetical protein
VYHRCSDDRGGQSIVVLVFIGENRWRDAKRNEQSECEFAEMTAERASSHGWLLPVFFLGPEPSTFGPATIMQVMLDRGTKALTA